MSKDVKLEMIVRSTLSEALKAADNIAPAMLWPKFEISIKPVHEGWQVQFKESKQ